ncbi:MAG TPA: hypothetical protein VHA33_25820 [Candidatus Angelobacter sp.]|jgi:hypothetical protein|nr:hypothetical protein [Candidatus Angelobacter sp.]
MSWRILLFVAAIAAGQIGFNHESQTGEKRFIGIAIIAKIAGIFKTGIEIFIWSGNHAHAVLVLAQNVRGLNAEC